ncbi:MAG TPA: glycosyltransferase family 2 protein, partial [Candidatus Thermoplasmatota archaeon]|nr:glycosyltransferase family 2 protein [Candidatus Thermoplasmatota archaeon]
MLDPATALWLTLGAAVWAMACRAAFLEGSRRSLAWTAASTAIGLLALLDLGPPARLALAGLAAQSLLEGRMAPREGRVLRLGGHLTVLVAGLLAFVQGPGAAGTVLAYAGGLAVLALRAHWAGRQRRPAEAGWDLPFLLLLTLGLGAVSLAYTAQLARIEWAAALEPMALGLALALAVPVLLLACHPPAPPRWLGRERGAGVEVVAHGAAAIAMLNILFLAFSLVSGWSLRLLFAALFAWQMLVIGMEYRTVRHAERRRRAPPPPAPDAVEPVTVIVPACNEAAVLPGSMARNLAVDYPLDFILVPAAKSTDGTVAAARRIAAANPGRVRVLVGHLGSKAQELNLAWAHAKTRYVLLLDADETIDRRSLCEAVAVLRGHPGVGVVQGRKVSRAPDDGFLARLVSAERRYCTWMDHVMHSESLGSGHFGGSAALLRREVATDVDGWTDQTLTEDIEFTLRLHLHGKWRIAYLPEMVVREADPATSGD